MPFKNIGPGMQTAAHVEDRRREFLKRLTLLGAVATAAAPLLGADSLSEKDFDLDLRSDTPFGGARPVADDPTSGCTSSCATCGCGSGSGRCPA
jgi:hypothetical protein